MPRSQTEEKLLEDLRKALESVAEDYKRVTLYGKTSAGVVTAVQVDTDGKLVLTTT